jgi:oligoribonuclease (3'-5' exoribonuclease)
MKFKPYVSIDLEFTSLDINNSQILEIGAVYDDGVSEIKDLQTFQAIIHYDSFVNPQLEALVINSKLLKEIKDIPKDDVCLHRQKITLIRFNNWLMNLRQMNEQTNKLERLVVAGKNAAGGDIPILKNNCLQAGVDDITSMFTHRTLDVGSMYFDRFGENVTLGKINELTGRSAEVSHRALDDAFDVVYAIRYKMNEKERIAAERQELFRSIGGE